MAEPFRPNLFQHATTHMSADSPTTSSKKPHLPSLHHHTHRHHHHHHSHSSRHRAKDVVQSAIPLHPPTSFGDLLRQARAKGSSSTTPSESRRGSVQEAALDGQAESGDQRREARPVEQKPVRPVDVNREQRKAKAREDDLRTSLQTLSDQSLRVSRRLDDTYYSILEKVSLWRQTIGSLQELAGLTKELHENLEADTQGLAEDIKAQFEGFENFDKQQEQVTALEARIKAGKEKADGLKARLEAAQQRVEARAQSEAELEARKIRRARIVWGILGSLIILVLLAVLFQQLRPMHPDMKTRSHLDFSSRAAILDAPIPDMAKEAIMSAVTPSSRSETRAAMPVTTPGDDDRLRIFDEL